MKRTALVSYSSSGDEGENTMRQKKKKLPSLPPSLTPVVPVDDPSLHQGRIRTTPHVDGQFAAYVYVAITLNRNSGFRVFLDEILSRAQQLVPTLHSAFSAGNNNINHDAQDVPAERLHVSLSRPTYLSAHQRDDFKRAVKVMATCHPPFRMSFATFAELTNDERTRTFLALEVGAGYEELRRMSEALNPALKSVRQKEFYANPRFHLSIGWSLLDNPASTAGSRMPRLVPTSTANSGSTIPESESPRFHPDKNFPSISRFPLTLIQTLNKEFCARLTSTTLGVFGVREVCLKIGRDESRWPLLAD